MDSQTIDRMLTSVGDSIRKLRLHRNLTQAVVAARSGISFGAYRNLELGRGATLRSFLAVCRTLDKTDWLNSLPPPDISPMDILRRANRPPRVRATATRKEASRVRDR